MRIYSDTMIYDLIIIGAGITGTMTAYSLAKYDLRVAVAEAGCDVAMGTTKANSAIVHAGYDAEPGTLKAVLNVKGCEMTGEIAKKLGVHYSNCGSHVVAFSEKEKEHLEGLLERGRKNGVKNLEIIGTEKLREMEPNISDKAVASLWSPSAGIICPYDFAVAAAENAHSNGTDFYFNFKVKGVTDTSGVYTVTSESGESVSARYIVNAAGLYAEEVAAICGEHDFPVKITPRRGEYLLFDKSVGSMVNSVLFAVPNENGKGILVSPTVDGNLITGPNAHAVDSPENSETTDEGLKEVDIGSKYLVPALNSRNVITSFAGVRSTPNTGDFYIKASEQLKNIVHAAGIESPGLASSPAIGEYISDLLLNMGLEMRKRQEYIQTRTKEGNYIPFRELSDDEKAELVKKDPSYGKIICRCETVTEGDILQAIRRPLGAKNLDMVKRRARAGMGRCQGGFCSPRIVELLAEELGCNLDKITKKGGDSWILCGKTK